MKAFRSAIYAVVLASAATGAIAETKYHKGDNSLQTEFCFTAATGSKIQLYTQARDVGSTLKQVAANVECNGVSITKFAENAGNDSVHKALLKYGTPEVTVYQVASADIDN